MPTTPPMHCHHNRTEFVIVMTGAFVVGCMSLVGILFMLDVQDEHAQMLALLQQILAQVAAK